MGKLNTEQGKFNWGGIGESTVIPRSILDGYKLILQSFGTNGNIYKQAKNLIFCRVSKIGNDLDLRKIVCTWTCFLHPRFGIADQEGLSRYNDTIMPTQ